MTDNPLQEVQKYLELLERRRKYHKLEYYKPYEYQERFHFAEGKETPGVLALQRALIAANKIGKTYCAAMEVAMHLTGKYPESWKGHRFGGPVDWLCASNTNDTTRDIMQAELFGDPEIPASLGSGTIPIDCVGKRTNKPGVPNAFDTVLVRHVSGRWSKLQFKAYEQGFKKFMGRARDGIWLDEEPPQDIWSQMVRATFAKSSTVIMLTFTPEEGMTSVVAQFYNNLVKGQALITATWDDAPHMTPEVRAEKLQTIPEHEREMRSRGTPLSGIGKVFTFNESDLIVEPMDIPRHWPQIIGIDFGWNHPFAAARLAHDRDNDVVYLIGEYRETKVTPLIHAAAIKPWGAWIPVAWPHDGLNTEKSTGDELIEEYRKNGLNPLNIKATNPPDYSQGQKEGEGGNSPEAAILDMVSRMQRGGWKVFRNCTKWLEEYRMYHRDKNYKLVKLNDDLISASRYAHMMLRHARTEVVKRRRQENAYAGLTNW